MYKMVKFLVNEVVIKLSVNVIYFVIDIVWQLNWLVKEFVNMEKNGIWVIGSELI